MRDYCKEVWLLHVDKPTYRDRWHKRWDGDAQIPKLYAWKNDRYQKRDRCRREHRPFSPHQKEGNEKRSDYLDNADKIDPPFMQQIIEAEQKENDQKINEIVFDGCIWVGQIKNDH